MLRCKGLGFGFGEGRRRTAALSELQTRRLLGRRWESRRKEKIKGTKNGETDEGTASDGRAFTAVNGDGGGFVGDGSRR